MVLLIAVVFLQCYLSGAQQHSSISGSAYAYKSVHNGLQQTAGGGPEDFTQSVVYSRIQQSSPEQAYSNPEYLKESSSPEYHQQPVAHTSTKEISGHADDVGNVQQYAQVPYSNGAPSNYQEPPHAAPNSEHPSKTSGQSLHGGQPVSAELYPASLYTQLPQQAYTARPAHSAVPQEHFKHQSNAASAHLPPNVISSSIVYSGQGVEQPLKNGQLGFSQPKPVHKSAVQQYHALSNNAPYPGYQEPPSAAKRQRHHGSQHHSSQTPPQYSGSVRPDSLQHQPLRPPHQHGHAVSPALAGAGPYRGPYGSQGHAVNSQQYSPVGAPPPAGPPIYGRGAFKPDGYPHYIEPHPGYRAVPRHPSLHDSRKQLFREQFPHERPYPPGFYPQLSEAPQLDASSYRQYPEEYRPFRHPYHEQEFPPIRGSGDAADPAFYRETPQHSPSGDHQDDSHNKSS